MMKKLSYRVGIGLVASALLLSACGESLDETEQVQPVDKVQAAEKLKQKLLNHIRI